MRINGEAQDCWIEELIDLCGNHSSFLSNGSILTILAATHELDGWLNDSRTYMKIHKQAWLSTKDDFAAAYANLGPATKILLKSAVTALNAPLAQLPADLERYNSSTFRADAITHLGTLMTVLQSDKFLIAAWRDLVNGSKDENLETNSLQLRRDNLWDAAKLTGHSTSDLGIGYELSGILEDCAVDIATASASLGDREYPDYGEINPQDSANLPIDDRLKLCERVLIRAPESGENVIWLCIRNATLPSVKFECGIVTFYNMEWLKGNLLEDGPSRNDLPDELINGKSHLSEYDFPKGKHLVWARIDLGTCMLANAPKQAKEILQAMLSLVGSSTKGWNVLTGYILFCDGYQRSSSSFNVAEIIDEYTPGYDHTPYMFQELETELQVVTSSSDPLLGKALKANNWLRDGRYGETLSRLVVAVRVIELVNSWTTGGTKTWQDYSSEFLKDRWCQDFLRNKLYNTVFNALHSGHGMGEAVENELGTMAADIIEYGPGRSFKFHLDKAITHLPRLVELFEDKPISRQLKEVGKNFDSGSKTVQALDNLATNFQLMLGRLIRYRNAAQHGGPIIDGVDATLDSFSYTLAIAGTQNTLRALLDGESLLIAQTDIKDNAQQKYKDLSKDSSSNRLFTD